MTVEGAASGSLEPWPELCADPVMGVTRDLIRYVTAATYERLKDSYVFQPGRVIRVKGKGEVLSYRSLSKI